MTLLDERILKLSCLYRPQHLIKYNDHFTQIFKFYQYPIESSNIGKGNQLQILPHYSVSFAPPDVKGGVGTGVGSNINFEIGKLNLSVPRIDAKFYIGEKPARKFGDSVKDFAKYPRHMYRSF